MNGTEDTHTSYNSFNIRRNSAKSKLHHPVLSSPDNKNIAGPAPQLVACNDNQGADRPRGGEDPPPKKDSAKLRAYCCDGQAKACFMHRTLSGAKNIWCRNWRKWAESPCISSS